MSISRFGIPTISKLGDVVGSGLTDASKGFTDFFNSLDSTNPVQEEFERQLEQKEQDAIDQGFDSVEEFERETDVNSIFNTDKENLDKFNPPDTIGFGITSLNDGRGIPDTPENRDRLNDIIQSSKNEQREESNTDPFNVNKAFSDFFNFFNQPLIPEANAEEFPQDPITVINASGSITPTRITDLANQSQKTRPNTRNSTRSNRVATFETDARSELETNQEFKTFTSSGDGRAVTGVIRATKQDPRELRTNSKGIPTETASQRANRVFLEQNEFADENRFSNLTTAKTKTRGKSFGTNTGRGSRISTTNRGGETLQTQKSSGRTSRQEALRLAEERARKVFDSGSIQN